MEISVVKNLSSSDSDKCSEECEVDYLVSSFLDSA